MSATPPPIAPPTPPVDDSPHSRTRAVIAIIVMTGFFAFIGMATFVKATDPQVALVAVGYVSGVATAVVGFYFGSSAGSESKSQLLARSILPDGGKKE